VSADGAKHLSGGIAPLVGSEEDAKGASYAGCREPGQFHGRLTALVSGTSSGLSRLPSVVLVRAGLARGIRLSHFVAIWREGNGGRDEVATSVQ
jgi:hypothetical protein